MIDRSRNGPEVAIQVAIGLLPIVLVVAVAGVGLADDAGAASAKAVPYCKNGQKSTTARPCVRPPRCRTGQKSTTTHPCTKTTSAPSSTTKTGGRTSGSTSGGSTSGGGTSTTSAGPTTQGGGGGGGTQPDGCPPGQQIPQGMLAGDGDEDNTGLPDDGDGCL